VWQCQTTTLLCLTGALSWGFLNPQQEHWTGYHALWSQTLSPADWEEACLLSLAYCWQAPLTAVWSPGAAVTVNRAPTTDYTVLIHTTHFAFINSPRNLVPEDVLIVTVAKFKLIMTNTLKRKFIMWPIREVKPDLSCCGSIKICSLG